MRRLISAHLLALTIALSLAPVLHAQVPFSACLDRQLRPIPGQVDNTIPYGAVATIVDGKRIILWNQHDLSQTSGTAQLFVYLHECAHHNLNHLFKGESRSIEDQADCWAYQLLVDGDMLDGSHLDELDRALRHWPGDVNHLGGEALLAGVRNCLALRTKQQAWDTSLSALTASAASQFADIRGEAIRDAPVGTFEATRGTPGTYDCELIPLPAVRCLVFAARKQKSAEKRFDVLTTIISRWLSADWTSTKPTSPGTDLVKSFIAQNSQTGTLLILGVTPTARVYFMVRPSVNH